MFSQLSVRRASEREFMDNEPLPRVREPIPAQIAAPEEAEHHFLAHHCTLWFFTSSFFSFLLVFIGFVLFFKSDASKKEFMLNRLVSFVIVKLQTNF